MGNVLSSASTGGRTTNYVTSESDTMDDTSVSRESDSSEEYHDTIDEGEARSRAKEEELEEFRRELNIKREQRKVILSRHRNEKKELEKALETEKKAKLEAHENNKQLRELLLKNNLEIPENLQSSKEDSSLVDTIVEMQEEFEKLKENNNQLRRGLTESNSSLQNAYSDIADLTGQNREAIKQIQALKEVVTVSKTMISLREQQLNEVRNLTHIFYTHISYCLCTSTLELKLCNRYVTFSMIRNKYEIMVINHCIRTYSKYLLTVTIMN